MLRFLGRMLARAARILIGILSRVAAIVWRAHVAFFAEFGVAHHDDPLGLGRRPTRRRQ